MKRHSPEEISSKLREAEFLMVNGLSQAEACKKLGVSVMTFHRWRKHSSAYATSELEASRVLEDIATLAPNDAATVGDRMSELQLENDRLRRIVTDMLLDNMKIEEESLSRANLSK